MIKVAHDFSCGWCWIGINQVRKLEQEFDVEFDFVGYELFPESMEWPESHPKSVNPNRPETPSRFDLAMAAAELPPVAPNRPSQMRTFLTHQAVEFARQSNGSHRKLIERLYDATWQHAIDINSVQALRLFATGLGLDLEEMERAIVERRYRDQVIEYDDPAYASGVYNLPTFFIGEAKFAEQPIGVLREALQKVARRRENFELAEPLTSTQQDRPAVINCMISTLDGKIVLGERTDPVANLGSGFDHRRMRFLESKCDAVMIGAGTLRATPGVWFDASLYRIVVTESGDINTSQRFFTDNLKKVIVISPLVPEDLPHGAHHVKLTSWNEALKELKDRFGIQRVLLEGGSKLNAALYHEDLVDELFLTVAPKIKLGENVPTIADGIPFGINEVTQWRLKSTLVQEDEVFLNYIRHRS